MTISNSVNFVIWRSRITQDLLEVGLYLDELVIFLAGELRARVLILAGDDDGDLRHLLTAHLSPAEDRRLLEAKWTLDWVVSDSMTSRL